MLFERNPTPCFLACSSILSPSALFALHPFESALSRTGRVPFWVASIHLMRYQIFNNLVAQFVGSGVVDQAVRPVIRVVSVHPCAGYMGHPFVKMTCLHTI